MKKIMMIILMVVALSSCKKTDVKPDPNYPQCWDTYQTTLSNDLRLYEDNYISHATYTQRVEKALKDYKACIGQ